MKKAVKDYGIIYISVLCWLLIVGAGSFFAHDSHRDTHAEKQATYSLVSQNHLIPAHQSENTGIASWNISYPASTESVKRLWAAFRIAAQLRENKFSQYVSSIIDFPVNRQKVELLFPFDYFW